MTTPRPLVLRHRYRVEEIIYQVRYRDWRLRDAHNERRRSEWLALALERLRDVGYQPCDIELLERHVIREMEGE